MAQAIELRPLSPAFGSEVVGFEPRFPLDDATTWLLRDAFDQRGLLVFRDLDLDFPAQAYLTKTRFPPRPRGLRRIRRGPPRG
jgi:taurine dioxygenase